MERSAIERIQQNARPFFSTILSRGVFLNRSVFEILTFQPKPKN